MNHIALLSVPIVWWRKPCEGLHAGMVHLLRGDVRKAPMTERSFLAGETEHVFEITNWNTRNVIHHGFGDTYPRD
jgi:hypothetical protein